MMAIMAELLMMTLLMMMLMMLMMMIVVVVIDVLVNGMTVMVVMIPLMKMMCTGVDVRKFLAQKYLGSEMRMLLMMKAMRVTVYGTSL